MNYIYKNIGKFSIFFLPNTNISTNLVTTTIPTVVQKQYQLDRNKSKSTIIEKDKYDNTNKSLNDNNNNNNTIIKDGFIPPCILYNNCKVYTNNKNTIEKSNDDDNKIHYYQRELKPPCIKLNSILGREMFSQAIHKNTMECYYPLSEQFLTQSEPAYCAITTLVMCFNALNLDPGIQWRKPWRWYTEEILGRCYPLHKVKENGITFSEFISLARCNGVSVESYYADTTTVDDFRKHVKSVCIRNSYTTDDINNLHSVSKKFLVSSYSRKVLNQTGDGHMSPIAGYHEPTDHILILDVARFKYPPYWVPLQVLWEAMFPHDKITKKSRGFCILSLSTSSSDGNNSVKSKCRRL